MEAADAARKRIEDQRKAQLAATKQYEDSLKAQAELAADREVAAKQFIRQLNEQDSFVNRHLLKQETLKQLTSDIADLRTRAAALLDRDQEVLAKGALAEAANLEKLRERLSSIGLKADEIKPILEDLFTLPTVTIVTPDDPLERTRHRLEAIKDVGRRTFESLNRGMSSAVVYAESFSDALQKIGRLLAFEGLRAFFQPSVLRRVFTGRATGGRMYAGVPYEVGERGREIVTTSSDAYAVPAHRVSSAERGGNVINTYLYSTERIDAATEDRIAKRIANYAMSLQTRRTIRRGMASAAGV